MKTAITLMDDADVNGQQIPASVGSHTTTVFGAANFAWMMCPGMMHGAAKMVEDHGTDRQKKLYMQPMYDGIMGGSMCLTEPQAGSDVGNISTVAKRMPDGTYRLKGQKIFITWGEHDLTENIVYPVLARIEGDPAGTKGISIFIVPKYRVNEDGTTGARNDVHCAGIEHKMGIHGSPTCTMVFGENDDCYGELLGQERSGMKIMFGMMNEARLGVGLQGLSMSEPAYLYALEYAADRKQGSSISEFKNPDAPRVSILQHPDVRRMIMDMKSKVEAMRALIGFTSLNIDIQHAAEGADKDAASAVVELLTPITKSWCTDLGFDVIETAIQVLGGHGFLRDHPLEQYMRDLKIASLYEGTNGIQAMDLLGRKLGMKGGMVFMSFLSRIDEVTNRITEKKGALAGDAALVAELRNQLAECAMALGMTFSSGDLELPLLNAKPFLDAMSEVVASWLLLWEAEVAEQKLAELAQSKGISGDAVAAFAKSDVDAAFYDTKIKTARYFIQRTLPVTKGKLEVIRGGERNPLDATFVAAELATAQ
jgi:alkylation response protein AidB-like acyl-CoA dehydrogenase